MGCAETGRPIPEEKLSKSIFRWLPRPVELGKVDLDVALRQLTA